MGIMVKPPDVLDNVAENLKERSQIGMFYEFIARRTWKLMTASILLSLLLGNIILMAEGKYHARSWAYRTVIAVGVINLPGGS